MVSFIGSIEGSTWSDTRPSRQHAREAAALLAVGEPTVVSHSSAAILWGLAAAAGDDDVHVTVIGPTASVADRA